MSTIDVTYYAVFAIAEETEVTKRDNLTSATFGNPSSYTSWSGKQAISGSDAVYAGQSTGGSSYIQLRDQTPSGIVCTASGGKAKKVSVTWNKSTAAGRTLEIYGSNTAYVDASKLYNSATFGTLLGTIVKGTSTEYEIDGDYSYIGLHSEGGAMYLDEIDIYWEAADIAYSAYCTTVSSLPVPTIVFKDADDNVITSVDATANDVTAVSVSCLDENDDPMDVTVTVTSSDDTVAEYDDGDILAYKSGTVTLTATFAGNGSYQGTSATLTVNVAKASSTTTLEVTVDDTDVYTATEDGLAVATVKDAAGTTIVGAEVTYTSSNTAVATIATDGTITLKAAGETTITASYAGTDVYDASEDTYVLTLTSSKPQDTSVDVTLNSTTIGSTAANGKTVSSNNVTITTNKGSATSDLVADESCVRMYKNSNLVIAAPAYYYIIGIEIAEPTSGSKWDGDPTVNTGTYSSKIWSGEASSVTFTFDGGQCRIASITVTLAETVTIGSAGYTTYVAKHDISFPDAVTAYIATASDASTVTLTSKKSVPEGTAIVVKGEAGTYALPTITTTPDDVSDNILLASDGSVKGDGSTIYALGLGKTGANEGKVGFYLVGEDVVIPAGKAYLNLGGSPAKEFLTFDFSETPDGIKTLSQTPVKEEGIYNLSGQRLNKMQKGINIVNGKKVLY